MKVPSILEVNRDQVTKVYSGKPGCGCGCRGKYSTLEENPAQVTRVLNALKADAENVESSRKVSGFFDEWDVVYSLETETRYRWVYVKF